MKKKLITKPVSSNSPLDNLPLREKQIVDLIYSLHEATATQIQETLEIELSNSAVRAMLVRLKEKGVLQHRIDGQRYLYSAVIPKQEAQNSALRKLLGTFFNNSASSAATALLGMSDNISSKELDELEQMIAKARKEGR